jgi:hypothetical protein
MRSKNRKWRPSADQTWMHCLYNGTPNVVVTYTIELEEWDIVSENIKDCISFTGMEGIYEFQKEGPLCKLREEKR